MLLQKRFPFFNVTALGVFLNVWLAKMVTKSIEEQRTKTNLFIYVGLVGTTLVLSVFRAFLFFHVSLRSSKQLHDRMTTALLKAPLLFFDTNPVGRILNRFSNDVGCMDESLPNFFFNTVQVLLYAVGAHVVPAVVNAWMVFVVVPVVISYFCIMKYFLASSRELMRLESLCHSPIFSHISETLKGLDTIRSRRRQGDFIQQFYR